MSSTPSWKEREAHRKRNKADSARRKGGPSREKRHSAETTSTSQVVNNIVSIHAVIHRARGVPATQWIRTGKPRPFVVATLLPFQWNLRTTECVESGSEKSGNFEPEWFGQQKNHLVFEPREGSLGQLTLKVQLWNKTSMPTLYSDKLIGTAEIVVPELPSMPKEQAFPMVDPMYGKAVGELVCTLYLQGVKGGNTRKFKLLQEIKEEDSRRVKTISRTLTNNNARAYKASDLIK